MAQVYSTQISKDLKFVADEIADTIEDWVVELYDEIRNDTPVLTRNLQLSWSINRPVRYHWVIQTNDSSDEYSSVIWAGRGLNGNSATQGSLKGWGKLGGQHLLDVAEIELTKRLKAIP